MINGICPNCDYRNFGWALLNPRNQTCPRCGTGLEIKDGYNKISDSYSVFTADRYLLNLPIDLNHIKDKKTRKQQ
jgi:hypothetical protein